MLALTKTDAEKGNKTIQYILSLYGIDVHVLFDTSSTHSFTASRVICHVPIPQTTLSYYLFVSTPRDVVLMGSTVLQNCEIKVHDKECPGNLVVLNIKDFDLIQGMDYLF